MATPTDQPTDLTKTTPATPSEITGMEHHPGGYLVTFDVKADQSGPVVTGPRARLGLGHVDVVGNDWFGFALTPIGPAAAAAVVYVDSIEDETIVFGIVNAPTTDTTMTVFLATVR
jgi:hypothetical protein